MINQGKNSLLFFSLIFIFSLAFVLGIEDRNNLNFLFGGYSILFIAYIAIATNKAASKLHVRGLFVTSCFLTLFFHPHLSEDYARFIWDGQIYWNGISPYSNLPLELTSSEWYITNQDIQETYFNITHLSQKHYTCYPPINQLFFKIATYFTQNLYLATILLKVEILIILFLGLHYFEKLNSKIDGLHLNTAFLFLNPLLIIETIGNVHFEGVMLSFLIIALYHLHQKKIIWSAIIFGLAIQIKLIPLILLPILLPYLKLKDALKYYFFVGLIFTLPFLLEFNQFHLEKFLLSLKLYFNSFEFNSVIYHYFSEMRTISGWPKELLFYSRILSALTFIFILSFTFIKPQSSFNGMLKRMMYAYLIYLLLTSTLHPWYIIPLLGISLLLNKKFVVLWSLLIFCSYFIYATGDRSMRQLVINLEYILVLGYFAWEVYSKTRMFNYRAPEPDHDHILPKDGIG